MGDVWLQLSLVAVLVLLNAAFAGSEIALISLREAQLRRLERRGRSGRALVRLARDPNRFLATIQIGITLAGFLASATAAVTLATPLVEPLSFLGGLARPAAIILVTVVLVFFTLVLGELAPKRLAMQRAERWGLLAARPLGGIAWLARPVVWLLGVSTDLTVRLLGGDPAVQREEVSVEDVREMVGEHEDIHPGDRRIIMEAFAASERRLRDVLVPRTRTVVLPGDLDLQRARDQLLESGHSRAPVSGNDVDDIIGIVHLRELVVDRQGCVADHVQDAMVLPESLDVLDSLRQLQAARQQLAIVVDEHGGFEGIVSVEDLLEELVGEIYDEFDRDIREVQRTADGALILRGDYPIHDLDDVGVQLPRGGYSTVAGLVLERLGRLPAPGETLEVGTWQIQIDDVDERHIDRVRLRPLAADPHAGQPPGEQGATTFTPTRAADAVHGRSPGEPTDDHGAPD